MPRRVSYDEAKFRQLWAEGVDVREIGREFGVGHNWASDTAKRLGLPRRQIRRDSLNAELLRAAYENGLTHAEIAEQLRAKVPTISPTTVRRALLRAGTTMRPAKIRLKAPHHEIARLFRTGLSRAAIAVRLGLSRAQVAYSVRKVLGPGPRGLPPRVDVAQILWLRRLGRSMREIGRAVGCRHSVVAHHLRKAERSAKQVRA